MPPINADNLAFKRIADRERDSAAVLERARTLYARINNLVSPDKSKAEAAGCELGHLKNAEIGRYCAYPLADTDGVERKATVIDNKSWKRVSIEVEGYDFLIVDGRINDDSVDEHHARLAVSGLIADSDEDIEDLLQALEEVLDPPAEESMS